MAGTERVAPDSVKAAPAPMTVGAADDVAERDADRRADVALAWLAAQRPMDHPVPETHVHTAACGIGRSHAPDSGATVDRATIGRAGGDLDGDTQREIECAVGGGRPLDAAVRGSMEQAFGTGLGRVRVHSGDQADRLSRSMSAEAFTTGHDIFFRKGAFNPGSERGQRVLAHELGHVVQNRSDVRRSSNPDDKETTEQEGEQIGVIPQIDKGTADDPVVMGSAGGVSYMNIRQSRLNELKKRDRLHQQLATGAALAESPLSTLFWGASRFLTDDPDKQAAAAQLGAAVWSVADGAAGVSLGRQQVKSVTSAAPQTAVAAEVRLATPSAKGGGSATGPVSRPARQAPPLAPPPSPPPPPPPAPAAAVPTRTDVTSAGVAPAAPSTAPALDSGAAPAAEKRSARAPTAREKKELAALIRSQRAEQAAGDVGLIDVEPGQETVLDLPEYREGIAAASAAFARLTNIEDAKNIAGTERSRQSRSGWSGDEAATDAVYHAGVEAGHETEPHRNDQGREGRYECSHSERKVAVLTGETSLASSKPVCARCQAWFKARAQSTGGAHFVADPGGVHVFLPDGRHDLADHSGP